MNGPCYAISCRLGAYVVALTPLVKAADSAACIRYGFCCRISDCTNHNTRPKGTALPCQRGRNEMEWRISAEASGLTIITVVIIQRWLFRLQDSLWLQPALVLISEAFRRHSSSLPLYISEDV